MWNTSIYQYHCVKCVKCSSTCVLMCVCVPPVHWLPLSAGRRKRRRQRTIRSGSGRIALALWVGSSPHHWYWRYTRPDQPPDWDLQTRRHILYIVSKLLVVKTQKVLEWYTAVLGGLLCLLALNGVQALRMILIWLCCWVRVQTAIYQTNNSLTWQTECMYSVYSCIMENNWHASGKSSWHLAKPDPNNFHMNNILMSCHLTLSLLHFWVFSYICLRGNNLRWCSVNKVCTRSDNSGNNNKYWTLTHETWVFHV